MVPVVSLTVNSVNAQALRSIAGSSVAPRPSGRMHVGCGSGITYRKNPDADPVDGAAGAAAGADALAVWLMAPVARTVATSAVVTASVRRRGWRETFMDSPSV